MSAHEAIQAKIDSYSKQFNETSEKIILLTKAIETGVEKFLEELRTEGRVIAGQVATLKFVLKEIEQEKAKTSPKTTPENTEKINPKILDNIPKSETKRSIIRGPVMEIINFGRSGTMFAPSDIIKKLKERGIDANYAELCGVLNGFVRQKKIVKEGRRYKAA